MPFYIKLAMMLSRCDKTEFTSNFARTTTRWFVFLQLHYSSRPMNQSKEQWDSSEFHLSSTSRVWLLPHVVVKRYVRSDKLTSCVIITNVSSAN